MLKIGVNTNNQAGDDFADIVKNIKNAGFDSVMIAFDLQNDEEKINIVKNAGLEITCVHLDYKFGNDLWLRGKSCDEYVNNVIKQIELCGKHGIKSVVFHCTWGSPNDIANKPSKAGLDNFGRIFDIAVKWGVVIAIENTDPRCIKYIDYIFKHFPLSNLAFCYDIGHHNLYLKKLNLIKKYKKLLKVVHIHDNLCDWEKGYDFTKDIHRLPFDGKINYEEICAFFAENPSQINTIMLEIHKKGLPVGDFYAKMSNEEFLAEAFKRAKKLEEMIKSKAKM